MYEFRKIIFKNDEKILFFFFTFSDKFRKLNILFGKF